MYTGLKSLVHFADKYITYNNNMKLYATKRLKIIEN